MHIQYWWAFSVLTLGPDLLSRSSRSGYSLEQQRMNGLRILSNCRSLMGLTSTSSIAASTPRIDLAPGPFSAAGDRAIALNPNSALAFGRGAIVRIFASDYATAAEHADRAIRLSPFDWYSFNFSLARGYSHLFRRQLPEAAAWLSKAAQQNPRNNPTFLCLGSALAHAGQIEEARAAMAAASPPSRGRLRVPDGGRAPGWPAGVTTAPVDTISPEGG